MSANRQAAWRRRRSSTPSSRPDDAKNRSVQAISSSPCRGERERSKLRSAAAHQKRIAGFLRRIEQRIEQALAHAEYRDHDLARLDRAHQIFQHQRGVSQQRAARGIDDFDLRQSLGIDAMHQPREVERLARRDAVIVHDVKRIAGLPHMQPRQRAPGAADGVEGAALAFAEDVEALEGIGDQSSRPS